METVVFNNPPALVRNYVVQWRAHLAQKKETPQAQIAILDDVIKMLDIALQQLKPIPAEPGNDKSK